MKQNSLPSLLVGSNRSQNLSALFLIICFGILAVLSIEGKSWTADEDMHLKYGTNILNGNSERFDDSKMPISAWNALPAKIASFLPEGEPRASIENPMRARWMTIFFSMLVAWMVFFWSRKLYGAVPAFASLILYILDPNILAHSQLVTTDIYITGMIVFCCYWLWKFASTRRWQDGLIFAILLGAAQLTKYTAVSLYPLLTITWFVHEVSKWRTGTENGIGLNIKHETGKLIAFFLVIAATSLIIINIGFLFNRSFTRFSEYSFLSDLFQKLQHKVDFLVPTPYPFLQGFDRINFNERNGTSFGNIYLLGEIRKDQGFKGYYIIASLFKVPLATQAVVWLALINYFTKKRGSFWRNEWFLLCLVLFYSIYFNFFYNAQIGIRYYLVVFPLLYIFAGSLFKELSRTQWIGALAAGMYLLISVLSYYPHYLGYFNEIVWDRKMAYRYLADSNLDWWQDRYALDQYLLEHIYVVEAPELPAPIKRSQIYFMSINRLVGVTSSPPTYEWLRENFEPFDTIGTSYLLFEITPEQMQALCDTTDHCQ